MPMQDSPAPGAGSHPPRSPASLWVRENQRCRRQAVSDDRTEAARSACATHPRPKKALGVGHGSAQDAGGVFASGVVWKHGLQPSPTVKIPPAPFGKGGGVRGLAKGGGVRGLAKGGDIRGLAKGEVFGVFFGLSVNPPRPPLVKGEIFGVWRKGEVFGLWRRGRCSGFGKSGGVRGLVKREIF